MFLKYKFTNEYKVRSRCFPYIYVLISDLKYIYASYQRRPSQLYAQWTRVWKLEGNLRKKAFLGQQLETLQQLSEEEN